MSQRTSRNHEIQMGFRVQNHEIQMGFVRYHDSMLQYLI